MQLKRIMIAALVAASVPCMAFADVYEEEYAEPEQEYIEEYEPLTGDEFMYQGVYEYGGRLETWYSSNVSYHYRTGEWWVDEEGFYRTDEGYYVVAASEDEFGEGSVIETSRGEAMVLDCGCEDGTTDFYVCW